MQTIGLYDIDFWHNGQNWSKRPNLDLMRFYHYYRLNNDRPIMLDRDFQKKKQFYNKIIYFKENPNFMPPPQLQLSGNNIELNGYGFFKKANVVPPNILKLEPDFIPYDLYASKIPSYDYIRKSALIRFATNDFYTIKEDTKKISILDINPLTNNEIIDFIAARPTNNYYFFNGLNFYDIETYNKYSKYANRILNMLVIHFPYNVEFLKQKNTNAHLPLKKKENETSLMQLTRIAKLCLSLIQIGKRYQFLFDSDKKDYNFIIEWYLNSQKESCYNYYLKKDKKITNLINTMPAELRTILKANPDSVNTKNFYF